MKQTEQRDRIDIKSKRGTWKRFAKLLLKCHLPWLSLAAYIAVSVFSINTGVDETDYTAQLFAGDTGVALVSTLLGVMLLNMLLTNLTVFFSNLTTSQMNRNMRSKLTEKILHLPMSFFKEGDPRDEIYRIVHNSIVISSTVMLVILPIAFCFYKTAVIFLRVFKYDWRLSLILIAFIPIQILVAFIFGRINFSLSERDSGISAGLTHRLAEMITNIPLAKAFAKEDREAAEGKNLADRLYKNTVKGGWFDQLKDLSESVISLIQAAVMVIVGALLLRNGDITTRNWVSFFMFSSTFSGAVYEILIYWNNLKVIQGGGDRVAEIMYAVEESKSGDAVEHLSGDIKIENLDFGYDENTPVLKNINAVFPQGSRTALLGESGSGKTTLLNLILRIYNPKSGQITVEGRNISEYALYDYRKQFAMISQNEMLFSGTVRENLVYGHENTSDEVLIAAAEKSGAWEFISKLPQGLDTKIDEYGGNLSGGQRQRLSLTRALLSDAPYLILDEPAAALDAIATENLINVLKDISEGRTLIVIGHTPSILPLVERAVILENGTVAAQGPVNELIRTNSFLRAFTEGKEAAE